MNCSACGASVPEGAAFCPSCGTTMGTTLAGALLVPSDIRALLDAVARLRGDGRREDAVQLCLRFIAVDPRAQRNAQAYEALGDLYQELENGAGAMDAYRRAVYLLPSDTIRRKYDELLDRLHGRAEDDAEEETPVPEEYPAVAPLPAVPVNQPAPGIPVAAPSRVPSPPAETMEERRRPPWLDFLLAPENTRLVIGTAVAVIVLSLLITFHPWSRPKKRAPFRYSIPGRATQTAPPRQVRATGASGEACPAGACNATGHHSAIISAGATGSRAKSDGAAVTTGATCGVGTAGATSTTGITGTGNAIDATGTGHPDAPGAQ